MALSNNSSVPSVPICIEAPQESLIQEVTLDGQEIYVQPLSMSENLARLAHRIDFSEDITGKATSEQQTEIKTEEEGCEAEASSKGTVDVADADEKTAKELAQAAATQPHWPWENVRNKIRNALQEVNVLLDVINISKDRRYMKLEPVQPEPVEAKTIPQMLAKKKNLVLAGAILMAGAENMRKSLSDSSGNSMGGSMGYSSNANFHVDLLQLRQNWRLKRTGKTIIGDLSYRSTGSRFWQTGVFEVTKADEEDMTSAPVDPATNRKSTLKVTIPSDLEGSAYLQVFIRSVPDKLNLAMAKCRLPQLPPNSTQPQHWQQKLEVAQNVLFCKEVFSQLAREAVQSDAAVPHVVCGNQILSHVFPDIQLCIALCHAHSKTLEEPNPQETGSSPHNQVLEHALHQLLREHHHNLLHQDTPIVPVTASIMPNKRRRLAGPLAADRSTLASVFTQQPLLSAIVSQAKHAVLRQRASDIIDKLVKEMPDPQMTVHWAAITHPLHATCRIFITSAGYDWVYRTPAVLHVETESITIIGRDSRALQLTQDPNHLKDVLITLMCQHHTHVVQSFSKILHWHPVSGNLNLGAGPMDPRGHVSSAILASPCSTALVAIRLDSLHGPRVYVKRTSPKEENPAENGEAGEALEEEEERLYDCEWDVLTTAYEEVDWKKIEGQNFMSKIEMLLGCLTKTVFATAKEIPMVTEKVT